MSFKLPLSLIYIFISSKRQHMSLTQH